LQEVLWIVVLVGKLHRKGAHSNSIESKHLSGLDTLMEMLLRVDNPQEEMAARRARRAGADSPLDPSDMKHMVELLHLVGVSEISATLRFRINTLRISDDGDGAPQVRRMLTSVRREMSARTLEREEEPKLGWKSGINLVRATNAFRLMGIEAVSASPPSLFPSNLARDSAFPILFGRDS
jgi:hypothetical protein